MKSRFAGRDNNRIYKVGGLTDSGQPTVQVEVCTVYEGDESMHGCQIVHYVTEPLLLMPESAFNLLFQQHHNEKYKQEIEKSLISIQVVEPSSLPLSSPRCKEGDIRAIDLNWSEGGRTGFRNTLTEIKWEAVLKNTASTNCQAMIIFQLLDAEENVLFNDEISRPYSFEPQEEIKVMDFYVSMDTVLIPTVHSRRVLMKNIQ